MARKKNPINDIVDTVGGWLGGRGPGTNPQVQAAMQATRAIARTADTATGGFGQALLSDAQRMAMTGSSTPSALYKTAAVNLGAAAAGAAAARVAGKVASKVVADRAVRATRAITPSNADNVLFHSGSQTGTLGSKDLTYKPVHLREGFRNIHMGDEMQAVARQETRVGFDKEADIGLYRRSTIDRYEITNPKAVSKRRRLDDGLMGPTASRTRTRYVQFYDDKPTPNDKILKYVNEIEGVGRPSYLVPKSRIAKGDVVYRGTKDFSEQFVDGSYTSPELNRLRNLQTNISAAQPQVTVAGAAAGVAAPKKKSRGGGKNKK